MTVPPSLAGEAGALSVWKAGHNEGTAPSLVASSTALGRVPGRVPGPGRCALCGSLVGCDSCGRLRDSGGGRSSGMHRPGPRQFSVAFSEFLPGPGPGLFCGGSMCLDSRPVAVRCSRCRYLPAGVPVGCGARVELGPSWLRYSWGSSLPSRSFVAGNSSGNSLRGSDGFPVCRSDLRGRARSDRGAVPLMTYPSGNREGGES